MHVKRSWYKREEILLAMIIVLAAVLRFYRLGGQSLWTDELLTVQTYTPPPGVSFWRKMLWDVHGPLHSMVLHYWSRFSVGDAWLRAPSAVAGVLGVFFVHRWMILLKMRDLALTGALLLALNPFHIYYSQELRFYSMLALFAILSLIAFERFLDDPSSKRGTVLGITLALTCLSHFSGGFLCLSFLVYLIVTGRLRGRCLRSAMLASGIVLAIISPWIYREIYFLQSIDIVDISTLPTEAKLRGELTLSTWSYPYMLYAFSVGYSFGPDLRVLHLIGSKATLLRAYGLEIVMTCALFGALLLSGLVCATRRGRAVFFVTLAVVPLALVTVTAMLNIKVFNVRYLTCILPIFVVLVSAGFPAGRIGRISTGAAVCAIMLVSIWNYHHVPRFARDDVRGAVKIVSELEKPGDIILAPSTRHTVSRYYTGTNEIAFLLPALIGEDEAGVRIRNYLASGGRIWYLRCRPWDFDPQDVLLDALGREGRDLGTWELPGIRLKLFGGAVDRRKK